MSRASQTITVDAPIGVVYDQWTQFEEFPRFMEGVKEVRQTDDSRLHWVAEIAGKDQEWDAQIVEQIPEERIAWRSTGGTRNDGVVSFMSLEPDRTNVSVEMDVEPDGLLEKAGDALGFVEMRVRRDLERFKDFIEERGTATGGWRGEISDGTLN
jgi:uncharacterized membrane protein